jgi:hypothetical protein
MAAWWDIGEYAREGINRPTEEEFCVATKQFWREETMCWGEIGGITEACFIYPYRITMWHRVDSLFRDHVWHIEQDMRRRATEFSYRRMNEGDRTSYQARLADTRDIARQKLKEGPPKKPTYWVHPDAPSVILAACMKAAEEHNLDYRTYYPPTNQY